MNKLKLPLAASICALVLAAALTFRVTSQKIRFNRTVREALKTSEGYDQKFIDMVNRLEQELALRASFGYIGQKDPMTGKERIVVKASPAAPKKKTSERVSIEPIPRVDPVKLTAIIFDDVKHRYTAIMMEGERSFAVEIGDRIAGRKITSITNESVSMEDEQEVFFYDIRGKSEHRSKKQQ